MYLEFNCVFSCKSWNSGLHSTERFASFDPGRSLRTFALSGVSSIPTLIQNLSPPGYGPDPGGPPGPERLGSLRHSRPVDQLLKPQHGQLQGPVPVALEELSVRHVTHGIQVRGAMR